MANSTKGSRAPTATQPDSAVATTAPAVNHPQQRTTVGAKLGRLKGALVAIASVGAIASGLVGYYTTYKTVAVGVAPASPAATANANAHALSILVLPFSNQTGDVQKAYVADAMTSSITSDLSRIRDAYVSSTLTALSYKDKPLTPQQIGKEAGVRFILQGNVLSSGEKIRIGVMLTDAQTGASLWSDTLDGDLTNLFALQERVTNQIASNIGREIVIIAARDSEKRHSSPKVADLLLRSAALNLKTRSLSVLQQIETTDRQILKLDPNNLNALTDLATALMRQALNFGNTMKPDAKEQKWEEVRAITVKVKELDPDNVDILLAAGYYAAKHDDFAGWRRSAELYLSLRPKDVLAYNAVGNVHIYSKEPEKAIAFFSKAISLDPSHPPEVIFTNMSRAYMQLDDMDKAQEWCIKGIETHSGYAGCYATLAMVYAAKGETAKLTAVLRDLRRIAPNYTVPENAKPQPSSPPAFIHYYETKYLPLWRKAGLPE